MAQKETAVINKAFIETVLGTYYMIGLAFIVLVMIVERTPPKPAWKWLLVPVIALAWTWFVFDEIRHRNRRLR